MVRYGLASILASILACTLPGLTSPAAAGTVYKWTDQRGVVNYSTAPPPEAQRMVVVDTTPAVATAGGANDEEARAWREQRARDLARDKRELESMRQRRETDQARQDQYRHQMAIASQAHSTEEERRRLAREACLRERRVDCHAPSSQAYDPYYPTQVIARPARQTLQQVSPFPVISPVIGPAPGTTAGTQALLGPFRTAATTVTRSAALRTAR